MKIESANGKHLSVIKVFNKTIEYLKQHAINHLIESGVDYPEKETKWVLTLPAIWTDPAKSIMRSAAEQVGLIYGYKTRYDHVQFNRMVKR